MDTKTLRIDGFDVVITRPVDEDPDTSCIGEWTDDVEPGVIVRKFGKFLEDLDEDEDVPERGREYRFFRPYAGGEKVGTPEYREYGMQDWKRIESLNNGEFCFIGILARAYRNGIELGHSSVCGFESDSGEEFLESEENSIVSDAVDEAKKALAGLCAVNGGAK